MHLQQLDPRIASEYHETERSEEAAIAGEIARHVLEWREHTSGSRAIGFITKLSALHHIEPAAVWVVLRLLTGDLSEVTRSYADLGAEGSRSKQACQQEQERVLRAIERHYPELSAAIVQLRHITAKYNGNANENTSAIRAAPRAITLGVSAARATDD